MCHYDDTYCTEVKRENKKKEEKDGDLDGVVEMGGETARVLYEGADIHVAACRHSSRDNYIYPLTTIRNTHGNPDHVVP